MTELAVGIIASGRITKITKFGAFVALDNGKFGLVHISEVANRFVSDINDFLSVGQEVQVKVLSVTDDGRVNLSIKQAQPDGHSNRSQHSQRMPCVTPTPTQDAPPAEPSFEDKLKQFLSASDSKMSELNRNRDGRRGNRKRR